VVFFSPILQRNRRNVLFVTVLTKYQSTTLIASFPSSSFFDFISLFWFPRIRVLPCSFEMKQLNTERELVSIMVMMSKYNPRICIIYYTNICIFIEQVHFGLTLS